MNIYYVFNNLSKEQAIKIALKHKAVCIKFTEQKNGDFKNKIIYKPNK